MTDESQGLGEKFSGVQLIARAVAGAQIASCELGSEGGVAFGVVFARICVVVVATGACRREGERLGCRVGAGD
jgi:hypothetical protein